MSYTLIRGRFHIHYPDAPLSGPQPDGDTLKFEPDQPGLVHELRQRGSGPDFNNRGFVNIRFEAIDALETHYSGHHQALDMAVAARDSLLRLAGYQEVAFHPSGMTVANAVPLSPRGYLLARTLDPYGRVVGFVFSGNPLENDGAQVCLRGERVRSSINAQLLEQGLVYPSFYDTLPGDLREALAAVARQARQAGRGLWPQSVGTVARPAVIRGVEDAQAAVLFPKLFRRLMTYFDGGATSLNGFLDWLRQVPGERDDHLVLPPMEFANLHDILGVDRERLWLTRDSDAFVIIDTPQTWQSEYQQSDCPDEAQAVAAGDLLIVAALPDPEGLDLGSETVTLLNTRQAPIDLAGYRLMDDDDSLGMTLHGMLAGGEARRFLLDAHVRLGNRGDTLKLLSPENVVLDQVSYAGAQIRPGRSIVFGRP